MTKNTYTLICVLILVWASSTISLGEELKGLSVGEKAPYFQGVDQFDKGFDLEKQLAKGPVVLIFYRGHWCKYCNQYLEQLNDSIEFIIKKGASVITVTPEKMEFIDETSKKFQGSFRIISDEGMKIMEAYQVKYKLDGLTNSKYKIWGINLDKFNGENGDNLPVPATYIIDQDGLIKYTFYNEDYKKRVPIKTILENL